MSLRAALAHGGKDNGAPGFTPAVPPILRGERINPDGLQLDLL